VKEKNKTLKGRSDMLWYCK